MKKNTIALLFALTLFMNGCTVPFLNNGDDERHEGIQLTLISLDGENETLSQPVKLPQLYATNTVTSLSFTVVGSDEIISIFDKKDVPNIVSKLIESFQKADYDEHIRFIYYGKSARETRGVTYIDEDGEWNWVFQKINASNSGEDWVINTGEYFTYQTVSTLFQGDIEKNNWVLTNKYSMPLSKIDSTVKPHNTPSKMKDHDKYNPKKEIKKVNDANERLRFLKKLLEGEYISEEDYQKQKEHILNRM